MFPFRRYSYLLKQSLVYGIPPPRNENEKCFVILGFPLLNLKQLVIEYSETSVIEAIVNRGNGYETRQSSLLYVFVLFFGLDPAQNTIVVYSVLRN